MIVRPQGAWTKPRQTASEAGGGESWTSSSPALAMLLVWGTFGAFLISATRMEEVVHNRTEHNMILYSSRREIEFVVRSHSNSQPKIELYIRRILII